MQLQNAGAAPGSAGPAGLSAGAPAGPAGPPGLSAGGAAPLMNVPGPASSAGQAIVNAVRGEVGVKEQPPGSNDSPRIAQYRQATAGSPGPGPWCAYFASWACRQAGVPVGDHGEGFGEHGVTEHGFDLYAAQTKVPFIVPISSQTKNFPPRR